MALQDEWIWAVALCALPFVVFGAIELVGAVRRQRQKALAQRPKGPSSASGRGKRVVGRG